MTKRERAARERLTMAQDECERLRGEALWCNGSRAGLGGDTAEMRAKEGTFWGRYGIAEKARTRAVAQELAPGGVIVAEDDDA